MKLYAETSRQRTRQLLLDAAFLLWVAIWTRIGMRVYELVDALRAPGRTIQSAGSDFSGALDRVAEDVEGVPLVGDLLRAPFEAVSSGGQALQDAGRAQQELVHTLALYLGVLLAVIPILYVLFKYVPDRVRWVREATAAHRIRFDADDLHLFALRAIANRPLHELRSATPDPGGDLAAGNYRALADLELRALGLRADRLPEPST